jgi:hypothetical protein
MGYQPRRKSPKGAIHEYKKPLRRKAKDGKRIQGQSTQEEKHTLTEKEVSEGTLKRLHTLGRQKFGSSPFSEHFDRWLATVEAVLGEFESHPNINVDKQFVRERTETLANIKMQLEGRRRKEASLDQEIENLAYYKSLLEQINQEYATSAAAITARKNSEIKRLYSIINRLKKDQDRVIRIKTGFFRGVSKKDREQKEIENAQELNDKQTELELFILDLKAQQKLLREEYERKREPVLEQIKHFQKKRENLETDGSLEERWFACEALIDTVNTFLQRKATQPH